MNLEAESYRQAFGFGRVSSSEFQKSVDLKAQEVNDKWIILNRMVATPGILRWVRLLFVNWTSTWAPKEQPCAVTSMSRFPLYEYKAYKGKAYFLRPERSPGFPGS